RSGSMDLNEWLNILSSKQVACLALAEEFAREYSRALHDWSISSNIPILIVPAVKRWSDLIEPVTLMLIQEQNHSEEQNKQVTNELHRLLKLYCQNKIHLVVKPLHY